MCWWLPAEVEVVAASPPACAAAPPTVDSATPATSASAPTTNLSRRSGVPLEPLQSAQPAGMVAMLPFHMAMSPDGIEAAPAGAPIVPMPKTSAPCTASTMPLPTTGVTLEKQRRPETTVVEPAIVAEKVPSPAHGGRRCPAAGEGPARRRRRRR